MRNLPMLIVRLCMDRLTQSLDQPGSLRYDARPGTRYRWLCNAWKNSTKKSQNLGLFFTDPETRLTLKRTGGYKWHLACNEMGIFLNCSKNYITIKQWERCFCGAWNRVPLKFWEKSLFDDFRKKDGVDIRICSLSWWCYVHEIWRANHSSHQQSACKKL